MNLKAKMIKKKKKLGLNLHDFGLGNGSLDIIKRIRVQRKKIDKLNSSNFLIIVLQKLQESQKTEWEEIFASHLSGKEFVPRMYNELLQFNNKKTIQYFQIDNSISTDISPKKVYKGPVSI